MIYRYSECPVCKTVLRRGVLRFGPSQIRCANCGLILRTGLTPWASLSPTQKFVIGVWELLAPSRLGVPIYALILNFIFVCTISSFSMGAFIVNAPTCGYGILLLEAIFFLVVPVIRLFRLIGDSNKCSRTGEPPAWKAGL